MFSRNLLVRLFLPLEFRAKILKHIFALYSRLFHLFPDWELKLANEDLHIALEADKVEEVSSLIHEFPYLEDKLIESIKLDSLESAKIFLQNQLTVETLSTALTYSQSCYAVEILVSHGARVDYVDIEGRHCVDSAAYKGKIEVAELLIEKGANPTPYCLHLLKRRGQDIIANRMEKAIQKRSREAERITSLVLLKVAPRAVFEIRQQILKYL